MSLIDDWNAMGGDAVTGTADYGQPPYADNSNGSPAQQVSDPTGNGLPDGGLPGRGDVLLLQPLASLPSHKSG